MYGRRRRRVTSDTVETVCRTLEGVGDITDRISRISYVRVNYLLTQTIMTSTFEVDMFTETDVLGKSFVKTRRFHDTLGTKERILLEIRY